MTINFNLKELLANFLVVAIVINICVSIISGVYLASTYEITSDCSANHFYGILSFIFSIVAFLSSIQLDDKCGNFLLAFLGNLPYATVSLLLYNEIFQVVPQLCLYS